MEDLRKEDSKEQLKDFDSTKNPLDTSVEGIAEDETTGSGYNEAERASKDATNMDLQHKGSRELIDKYNINDQAHSDSSKDNFVKTISNNNHADGSKNTSGK
ncbi:hypothetical protein J2X31_000408 [Flavobacterium arsenatis]|uniref:Uncharacterized protein n=1 Tax=Flavobacterium arsenatis TaxID=1484332 RepID=A0ABU1TKA3_9FLAO|nr:hypothetical protein [Flavobacterium arsenatis]MDR6966415.1 hypothetical protein [Flavobacterium arsenatis]